jgi:NADPH2:quinone reductase
MATMKVIQFHEYGDPEVLQYEEIERPTPGSKQVLVKIEALGINYADTMRRRNNYLERTPLPYILGGEIAGTIEELGPDVPDTVKVGDRVVGMAGANGYAQYTVMPYRQLYPLPPTLTFSQGAAVLVQGMTAYDILRLGQLKPGESVLVHAAAGGVGVFSVQLAKLMGAGQVIATASSPAKLELARSLGADQLVNYTEPEWYNQVKELTGGKGVDVILEMVGGEIFNQNLRCLAPYGRMVVFGAASNQVPTLNPIQLMYKNQTVTGYWMVTSLASQPQRFAQGVQEIFHWIAEGKVKIIVDRSFPLSEAAQAHTLMESRQTVGKLVLLPQE